MRQSQPARGVALMVLGVGLVALAFGGGWLSAPDRTTGTPDGEAVADTTVLVGVQGPGPRGNVTELDADGSVLWTYDHGNDGDAISYQNVQYLDGTFLSGVDGGRRLPFGTGHVLTTFADDGYRNCGPYEPPCKRTGVRVVDPGPTPEVVYEWSYPVRTRKDSEVHDAELLPSGEVLVAGMEYERIFTFDPATGERTWTWNASDHYEAPPDPTRVDWLHINDVDRIGEGRYLVSVRNANQLVVVERGAGVVEVVNEDGDPDVLNEQHNPQWLGDGRVLVADSENDRVVELHRNGTTGEWEVAWMVTGAGGMPLEWPRDADRLSNGNTVITDSGNDRVVVVDENGSLNRSYATPLLPYEADVLPFGEQVAPTDGPPADRTSSTGTARWRLPVLSTVLAAARHVLPVPYWVSELQLFALVVALPAWLWGLRHVAGR